MDSPTIFWPFLACSLILTDFTSSGTFVEEKVLVSGSNFSQDGNGEPSSRVASNTGGLADVDVTGTPSQGLSSACTSASGIVFTPSSTNSFTVNRTASLFCWLGAAGAARLGSGSARGDGNGNCCSKLCCSAPASTWANKGCENVAQRVIATSPTLFNCRALGKELFL